MTQRLLVGKTIGMHPPLKFSIYLSYLTIADKFACCGTENCPCALCVGKVVSFHTDIIFFLLICYFYFL